MMRIKTPIDHLLNYIEGHSPVKESRIPKKFKQLETFENHIRLLEDNGMIELKMKLFSAERILFFKSNKRSIERDPWALRSLEF